MKHSGDCEVGKGERKVSLLPGLLHGSLRSMQYRKSGFAAILSFLAGFQLALATLVAGAVETPDPSDGAKPCHYDGIAHPRTLVTASRLEFLRADIKTNAARAAIYQKDVKANADRWVNRAITIPEQGGWPHDYCGPDGVLLEIPVDQQFDPSVPSRSPSTGKTYDSEKIRAARRYFEQNWLSFATRDLGLAYAMEQQRAYADKAAEILLKYADAYPHFIAEKKGFGYQQFSIEEAVALIPLAQGYDLIYASGALTDQQKQHIERDFLWPEAQRLSVAGLGGNWGSWHLSAVGVIGCATGHQRFIDYAANSFKSQITTQLGDDGLWPESVHCYHFYPLDAFLSFAEAATNCGDDLFHWEAKPGKGLEAMFESPLRYMYPTFQLPAINDGWYDAYLPGDQYAVASWHYHKPEFAWAVSRTEELGHSGVRGEFYDQRYRLFLFGDKRPDSIPAPVFTSTNFPVLGISILRQGSDLPVDQEMFMTFHYGAFRGHGHFDKMGVTLFANGQPVAAGLGTPGYGSPNIRFFNGVTAHNTIAADQANPPRTTDSNLIAFYDQPQLKLAASETRQAVPGTKWVRAVLLADNYAVIWDDLHGDRNHAFDWFLHAFGDNLTVTGASSGRPADTNKGGEFAYPFLTEARIQEVGQNSVQADWLMSGNKGLRVWMMSEPNDALFTARCPATDGSTMPLVVLRKNNKDCQFVSVLEPWKEKPADLQINADRSDPNVLRLTIAQAGRTDVISFDATKIGFDFNSGGGSQEKQINVPLRPTN